MSRPQPAIFAAARVIAASRDLVPGYIEVTGGIITAVRPGTPRGRPAVRFDGTLIPGLIDLQVNGVPGRAGVDFLTCRSNADVRRAAKTLASGAVTAFLPTLISSPPDVLRVAITRWRGFAVDTGGAAVLGLHLEGPYLNPVFAGAHDPGFLRIPNVQECESLLDTIPGFVRLVTLAPELPGAIELIRTVRARRVAVALGHTAATMEDADAAFDAGATLVTHLFNAMRPVHHRDPGIVVAALRRPAVTVGLIADLVHLHPAVLSLVIRLKGVRRVALISDAVAAPGTSGRLAGRRLEVTDAPRLAAGTLAGTTLLLSDAVSNLTSLGTSLRDAVLMASAVPAAVLGLRNRGRLSPGARADFAVLDDALRPVATYVGGAKVFTR